MTIISEIATQLELLYIASTAIRVKLDPKGWDQVDHIDHPTYKGAFDDGMCLILRASNAFKEANKRLEATK